MPPFTEEHEELRASIRGFVERELTPHVEEWEREKWFPNEVFHKAAEHGFLGLKFPEEYGGEGGNHLHAAVFCEELSRTGSAGLAVGICAHVDLALPPVYAFGTEDQRQRYLVPGIKAEKIGALAITEPGAGSDVANIQTRAEKVEGGWIVNGEKVFITNGVRADFYVAAVKTSADGGHGGMSFLIIDHAPGNGISATPLEKLGWHCSDTGAIAFQDVFVPDENLLGEVNGGFKLIMENFQWERLVLTMGAIAGAEMGIEVTLEYVKQREAFGKPIGTFQVNRHKLAQMATELYAARAQAYDALRRFVDGENAAIEVSMVKLFSQRVCLNIADECVQLHGGAGYLAGPIERGLRDARLGPIGGGTDEIMREIIGRSPVSDPMNFDDRAPVLVGLGEATRRAADPPLQSVPAFIAHAMRCAAADAYSAPAPGWNEAVSGEPEALLQAVDLVAVAPSASWPDQAPGLAIAAELGIQAATMRSSMVGGNGSQLLVNEVAARIQSGDVEVALVCGGEALHSQRTPFEDFGAMAMMPPDGSTEVLEEDHPGNSPQEIEVGLMVPVLGYALMEQAIGRAAGRTTSQQADVAAELWAQFAAVAAEHPNAWIKDALSAEAIRTATPENRQVSWPYTKFMVANLRIDEAAGVVMCSAGAAQRLGIPESRWVYVHAGAQANDEWFLSERTDLDRAPAIAACGQALFDHAGVTADELGPGNNFGTHGVIGVARALRQSAPGTVGLSSSLGWYATKHAIGLYGNAAPTTPYATLRPTPAPAKRELASAQDAAAATGATVEVATAFFGREGIAEFGIVFALLPDGRRALGKTTDPAILEALCSDAFAGRPIRLAPDRTVELA